MSYFKKACAVPITWDDNQWKFVLVKSINGNWIFPKGAIKKRETYYEACIREAQEEAGAVLILHGTRIMEPIGSYVYKVNGKRKPVIVFALFFNKLLDKYLESDNRERKICTYKKARKLIKRKAMRRILKSFYHDLITW